MILKGGNKDVDSPDVCGAFKHGAPGQDQNITNVFT